MNKPTFTPGPWVYSGRLGFGHLVSPNIAVAYGGATSGRQDSGEANARLIAAAPDMYEALLAAKVVIEMMERPEGMGGRVNAALDKRLAQIDAAIAKAEGREA